MYQYCARDRSVKRNLRVVRAGATDFEHGANLPFCVVTEEDVPDRVLECSEFHQEFSEK
jgi:hypothetical protein